MYLTVYAPEAEKRSLKYMRAGFTIIELMIAIVILGIIMAVVTPAYFRYLDRARKSDAKQTVKAFKNAIMLYNADTGQYPQSLKDLIKKPTYDENVARKWQGPYLDRKEIPNDGWGNKYIYRVTPEGENPYELYSYGSSKGKATPKNEWIDVWKD